MINSWMRMSCFTVSLALAGWLATGRWRDFVIMASVFIVFHPVYMLICQWLDDQVASSEASPQGARSRKR
jgi:hypothetical protein